MNLKKLRRKKEKEKKPASRIRFSILGDIVSSFYSFVSCFVWQEENAIC